MRKTLLSVIIVFAILFSFTQVPKTTRLSAAAETIDLPVVMYHSVLKSRKGKYVIHPDKLERDIIAFKELGYTPVTLRDVVDWIDGKNQDFPKKPMIITFDDGHYNNLYYALPILKKHNCKAVINIVTSFSKQTAETPGAADNPAFSYLTWDNIRELHESSHIEIGNHTHAMHKLNPRYGIAQVGSETVDEYKKNLGKDIEYAENLITACGVPKPVTFAYPFGKYNNEARELLKELGYRAILTCNEGIARITKGDPKSLLYLKRYNRNGNITTEQFIKKIFTEKE